jgi:hypothetical protein
LKAGQLVNNLELQIQQAKRALAAQKNASGLAPDCTNAMAASMYNNE